MNSEFTAQHAAQLDAEDPLRGFRSRFTLPAAPDGNAAVYFCGHSLGLQPRSAREIVLQELDIWAQRGIAGQVEGERAWVEYVRHLKRGLAMLVGAEETEVVAMNGLTVNLHLMLASFYRPTEERYKILMEAGAFASDRHAVASQIAWHRRDPASTLIELAPRRGEELLREEDIEATIAAHGRSLALVHWPGVQFRSGQAFNGKRIVDAAHRVGAIAGFDHAHAIGNIPLRLHADDADYAVWCSYKYLNGGPGAVGGAFVNARHFKLARLAGWWGHDLESRFLMAPGFVPAHGADGWQISNPPILATAPLLASLALFEEAGTRRLFAKSRQLTAYLADGIAARCAQEVTIVTPRDSGQRGCHLSLRIAGGAERGQRVFDALGARGIVGDWRAPDVIRVAPVPLYNTFTEAVAFVAALEAALASQR